MQFCSNEFNEFVSNEFKFKLLVLMLLLFKLFFDEFFWGTFCNFNFNNVSSYTGMFNSVPSNCEIIVADDNAKRWITSKFSNLTNVKTVGEL